MRNLLITETKVISEIRRQRELMGLKPVILNEDSEKIPFLNKVVKFFVENFPGSKLDDLLGGNATAIIKRLAKKGINSIESLEKELFQNAGKKIDNDLTKNLVKSLRQKVFKDPSLSQLANESVVSYFERLGNLQNGANVAETVKYLLTSDLKKAEVKNEANAFIAKLKLKFGADNDAVLYLERQVNELSAGKVADDVNTPKPSVKVDTPDADIKITAPKPSDVFDFDFNGNNLPDPEKLPDIAFDYDAGARAMEFEPEKVGDILGDMIRDMADKTPLFKGLPEAKKLQVIDEIKSQFVNLYNKQVTDANAKILGDMDNPKVLAQIEKGWKSVSTTPSAKQALLDKALKESKVKLSRTSKQFWMNYITGKSASTGAEIGPKQWATNYRNAVYVSAGITVAQMIIHSITQNTNVGWDNLPGDNTGEKIYNLFKPGEALFKAILPPFLGSILLAIGADKLLINKYRKPSTNEIREKLLIKNEATVEVKDIPANTYKDAEYSRTVLINGINVGDWTLEIETKKLVKMRNDKAIPEEAKTGSTDNTPAPPTPTTKITMTKAEVEALATNSTNGFVKPLTFTPDEDNKAEYSVTDKDGDKFTAKLNNGVIVITSA